MVEVVERGPDDRQRRVQFVGELGRERAQVFGIRGDFIEQPAETAREVAEFVGRVGQRQGPGQAAAGARGAFGGVAQTPDPPAQQAAEQQQQHRRDEQGQQARREQARQCAIGQHRQGRVGLFEDECATQRIVAAQRHRGDQQHAAILGAAPARGRRSGQGLPQIITLQARIDRSVGIDAGARNAVVGRLRSQQQPIDPAAEPARCVRGRHPGIERSAGGDQPAVGRDHAHAHVFGRQPGQHARGRFVVAEQGQGLARSGIRHRRVVHVEAHMVGRFVASHAQLDAVARTVLLPLAGQTIGKRADAVDRRRVEAAGGRAGDAVAPALTGPAQVQIEIVAARDGRVTRVDALAGRIANAGEQIQPLRILGQHDLEFRAVAIGGEGLRIGAKRLPVIGVAVDAEHRAALVHIERGIGLRRLDAEHVEGTRQGARRGQQGLLLALAQHRFGLAHELPAGPGQGQGRQGDQQEFQAEGHWKGGNGE